MVDPVSDREYFEIYEKLSQYDSGDYDYPRLLSVSEIFNEGDDINLSFLKYLRSCSILGQFNTGLAFIAFCNIMGLDERKTFLELHDKMRALVVSGHKKLNRQ